MNSPDFTGLNPYLPIRLPTSAHFLAFLERREKSRASESMDKIRELADAFALAGWRDDGGGEG